MNRRGTILILLLFGSLVGGILYKTYRLEQTTSELRATILFGVFFIAVAFLGLIVFGKRSVDGLLGLSRVAWVAFGSYASALTVFMLGGVLSIPWFGFKAFELLSWEYSWAGILGLTALMYPIVSKWLK